MVTQPEATYTFGTFQLDPGRHLPLRNGEPVPLPPKVFAVLQTLVEAEGRLVAKEALLQAVWADSFVEEGTLKQHISILRRALKDDENGEHYIETIPKLGYRFAADVRRASIESSAGAAVHRRRPLAVALAVAVTLVLAAAAGPRLFRHTAAAIDRDADALPRRLTFNVATDFQPDWSPDGRKIAFMSSRDGKPEIYVMDADGSHVTNLTRH